MKEYTVYFEVFGKKMKTKVVAVNEDDARKAVLYKIVFHAIKIEDSDFNNLMNEAKDLFSFLDKKL